MEQCINLGDETAVTYDQVVTALLLTDVCRIPNTLDTDIVAVARAVAGWTQPQLREAMCWAWTEHIGAGDNVDEQGEPVKRLPCPPHVAILRS